MTEGDHTYDVAVSFAGAQRPYVERVVKACEAVGLRVFYDRNETVQLWGHNVIPELRKVYGGIATRYVIPFLSREYLAGPYPMDEFYAAMRAAIERTDGYLLPLLMDDDTVVPPELLDPAIIYLRAKDYSPEDLAGIIAEKVRAAPRPRRESPDTHHTKSRHGSQGRSQHIDQQPFPAIIPATGPERPSFRAGAEIEAGRRAFLIHDYLAEERWSSDHAVVRRRARCTQLIPAHTAQLVYGWFRQVESHETTQRTRDALGELARESDLLNMFGRLRVPGLPGVIWSASDANKSTLVTTWPAPRDGKPHDTLDALLDGSSSLDRVRLYRLCSGLADLCGTLGALHGEGLSHRCLSPDEIVSARGHLLLLRDLGLAVRPYEPGEGPANYQAPEQQLRAAGRGGPPTDIYQLAAVAYHLITGQIPHSTAPLPVRRLAPDVPERLGAAVDAGLATDPADRPDMRSLRSQLKAGCADIS
ncbi:MAG TPA: TIR domain-containing protein [Pseudonocardiaceae bacterium]|jgi:hypothetical protein|nr:TIR domain-containing protein [Pseudonocardiaceae bacterium]